MCLVSWLSEYQKANKNIFKNLKLQTLKSSKYIQIQMTEKGFEGTVGDK